MENFKLPPRIIVEDIYGNRVGLMVSCISRYAESSNNENITIVHLSDGDRIETTTMFDDITDKIDEVFEGDK